MKILLMEISVRDVVAGYVNNDEEGVFAYGGRTNVRPPYQREMVYDLYLQGKVIETIKRGFPLNTMYWVDNGDGTYEVLDGQQRTLSICEYVFGKFSVNSMSFANLPADEQEKILDYKLMIYFCSGTESERLDWFRVINTGGLKLTEQELRNANYPCEWLTEAKKLFSKTGCPASKIGSDYMDGAPIRQDYLETVLAWISNRDSFESIEAYMDRQKKNKVPNADELWSYFRAIIAWVQRIFPKKRHEMKKVDWGLLYNKFKDVDLDPVALESEVSRLMMDEDVTKKSGIYAYLLDGEERHLNIRAFSPKMKREAYERQEGICVNCHKHFELEEMEADHIDPWHEGGATIAANCQLLCKPCNRRKGGI